MTGYESPGPSRDDIDSDSDPLLLEFGTSWCGHCQVARPGIDEALSHFPGVRHIQVEDGPGRRLGRSFGDKLWPTLIALKNGVEIARIVRPETVEEVRVALSRLM